MQQQPQPQFVGGVQRWPGTASLQDVIAPSQEYLMRQLAATAPVVAGPPLPAPPFVQTAVPAPPAAPRVVLVPAPPAPQSRLPDIASGACALVVLGGIVFLLLNSSSKKNGKNG